MFAESDFSIGGATAHMWEGGSGFPLLLMHGVGPGTSTLANFGRVLEPLAARYHLFATDLVGFGLSGRKSAPPYFDYDLWLDQVQTVLDRMPEGPVGVIGHSLSGSLGLRLAARHRRVEKLLLSCPLGTDFEVNESLARAWTFPSDKEDLRETMSLVYYDTSSLTDDNLDYRYSVLTKDGYGAYFDKIFAGDKQALVGPTIVTADEIARISAEVVIVHGREDRAVPIEATTEKLARMLKGADIHALARCAHGPATERTEEFMAIATALFG